MNDIRAAQQKTWATGDFSMIATGQVLVGELLCESLPVHAGDRVLDAATGSGNTALAAARRGCEVTAIDFVPALLDRGRERAAAERLRIDFREGEVEAIPLDDGAFDVVLSTFGAMFGADPMKTAAELLRVCRPGGKIGMANWVPSGMIGEMFRLTATFAAPPPGVPAPSMWGVEENVRERFGDAVEEIRLIPRRAAFRHRSPDAWVEAMKKYFGPTIRAHEAAGARAPELTQGMADLARRHNQSGDATLLAYGDYVEVIAVKRSA